MHHNFLPVHMILHNVEGRGTLKIQDKILTLRNCLFSVIVLLLFILSALWKRVKKCFFPCW